MESLDRVSRENINKHLKLFLSILDYVDIITLIDGKRYRKLNTEATDLIISIIHMKTAYEENEKRTKRIKDAKEHARNEIHNKKLTKQGPFWLTLSDDRKNWFIKWSQTKTVKTMFKKALAGEGTYKIMTYLNSKGIA